MVQVGFSFLHFIFHLSIPFPFFLHHNLHVLSLILCHFVIAESDPMSSFLSVPKGSHLSQSQTSQSSQSRRSTRVSPLRRDTSFVSTSGDSRRSLYLPEEDEDSQAGADEEQSERTDPSEDGINHQSSAVEQTTPTRSIVPQPKKRAAESQVQAHQGKKPRKSNAKGKGTWPTVTVRLLSLHPHVCFG